MSNLDAALKYATNGYAVLPCEPGGSKPFGRLAPNGCKNATTDADIIRKWWHAEPSANIGIECSGIIVIDCDTGNEWSGVNNLAFEDVIVQRTPSGGQHFIFKRPDGHHWRNSVSRICKKVDTRTDGGYIVVEPSTRDDGAYRLDVSLPPLTDLSEPPSWLIEQLDTTFKPSQPTAIQRTTLPPDASDEKRYQRAKAWLQHADAAVAGDGGHATTLRVASTLSNGFVLSDAQAWQLLVDYNTTCDPPWTESQLRRKLDEAVRLGPPDGKQPGWMLDDVATGSVPVSWTVPVPQLRTMQASAATIDDVRADRKARLAAKVDCGGSYGINDPPFIDAIVAGMFGSGDKTWLIGPSKCKKSFYAIQAAISIAAGVPFMDWDVCRRAKVLYLNLEIQKQHFHKRLHRMYPAMGVDPHDVVGWLDILNLRGEDWEIEDLPPCEFLIIDPLYQVLTNYHCDENSSTEVSAILKKFSKYANETGAAMLIVHHDAKGRPGDRARTDRGSGTSVMGRDLDAAILLTPHASEDGAVVVDNVVRNYGERESFTATWDKCFAMSDIPPKHETSITALNKQRSGPSEEDLLKHASYIVASGPITTTDLAEQIAKEKCIGMKRAKEIVSKLSHLDGYEASKDYTNGGRYTIRTVLSEGDDF